MKYVLITPNEEADVLFFIGVSDHDASGFQHAITTELLSDAHVFEYQEDTMQYILNKFPCLQRYTAIPVADVDIFKAKLAGI